MDNGRMNEKLCIFCEHFAWEKVGYTYYSTLTGGDMTGGTSCKRLHFFEENPKDECELRAIFLRAESCKDYAPPVKVKTP